MLWEVLGLIGIFGKGIPIPPEFLSKLSSLGELTKGQKNLVGKGIQSGSPIVLKPTQRQIQGGFLGTLAAIGIPMAIELASKLFGKGLQVPKKAGMGLQVSPTPFLWQPPPFLGTWEGQGKGKGKKEKGFCWGKKSIQPHSPVRGNIMKPPFKDIPLSNFDLLEWVTFLGIQNLKGIFSRHAKDHWHRSGCCIINLDDSVGKGSQRMWEKK